MQILTALALAIVPVLNAFMILLILACICERPRGCRPLPQPHARAHASLRAGSERELSRTSRRARSNLPHAASRWSAARGESAETGSEAEVVGWCHC